nr:glutathione S-transferase D5-like [Leptinotarsa decemlineata]
MTPKLYSADLSPAVRASLLAIRALGVDVELVPVNLMEQDHMKPEYLKMNPFHTVPTLEDGDFAIWDSAAINIYLTEKYGKDDSLYPSNPEARAVVNQRLFFNSGILFPRMGAIVASLLREGAKTVSKDKADSLTQGQSVINFVSPAAKQHLTPEYLKLNPLHTIPTLEDGDFVIYDSHAIIAYLADKYADGGALYPKDVEKRAIINQRMYFDCGTLFPKFIEVIRAFFAGAKTISKDFIARITEGEFFWKVEPLKTFNELFDLFNTLDALTPQTLDHILSEPQNPDVLYSPAFVRVVLLSPT